jgi:nucleoid-associated protein YgaU
MAIHRYNIAKIRKTPTNKRALTTTIPPKIEKSVSDTYIYTRFGDRLDLLANEYYDDRTKWVYIAAANNLTDMNVKPGTQLRIPADPDNLTSDWQQQNTNR